jgi:hypothetical protein
MSGMIHVVTIRIEAGAFSKTAVAVSPKKSFSPGRRLTPSNVLDTPAKRERASNMGIEDPALSTIGIEPRHEQNPQPERCRSDHRGFI